MVTVARFAEAVLPHGTTTVLIDNHEIANVLGLDGIRWMLEEGSELQLKVLLAVPSCVPALPGFEDAGATITPDDIREALEWEGVAGLGEMMNMPGVIESDPATHAMIDAVLDARLPVTGHWSLHGWDDHRLHAYVAAGVDSDHETVLRGDALAKLRAGMWVQLREGSAWHDVEKLAPVLLEDGVDSRHALLVTDDMHPETLATVGHLNHAVRTAIAAGIDPLVAIQMATVNAAEYIGRRHDIGSIAPGRCADILLVEDLPRCARTWCWPTVSRSARDAGLRVPGPRPGHRAHRAHADRRRPAHRCRRRAGAGARDRHGARRAGHRAPGRRGGGGRRLGTRGSVARPRQGREHRAPRRAGHIGVGFVQGLGLERGAVATTVAHDNHNLFVVGMDDGDMLAAVERLRETGGGMVAVDGGEVTGEVRLPIAGLMSDRSVEEVADEVRGLDSAYKELGCRLEYPFMMVSFLSLGVIPALRLTNRGLVDGREFALVDPVVTDATRVCSAMGIIRGERTVEIEAAVHSCSPSRPTSRVPRLAAGAEGRRGARARRRAARDEGGDRERCQGPHDPLAA